MAVHAERTSFRDTWASVALDAVRGLAAVLVLLDHCQRLYFVPVEAAQAVSAHPRWTAALYALDSAGIQAVVIFFVLSGYLISGSVFRSFAQGRWSWKEYLTHRFVRLWLVLLPALALGGLWDAGRIALAGHGGGADVSFTLRMAAAGITWKNFFGNVLFLQGIRTAAFGSDRVLWSLAAEFWYYLLFPLGLVALRPGAPVRSRLLHGAGFVLVAAFVTRGILALFPVWLLGTALAMVKPPRASKGTRWVALALYAPCVFWLATIQWPWRLFKMDYLLGMITALFLWVLLSAQQRVSQETRAVRMWRTLARFSYSLYLVHYPMLLFFAVLLSAQASWRASTRTFAIAAGLCAAALSYGYCVAAATEFQNERVRRWVEARLGRGRRVHEVSAG